MGGGAFAQAIAAGQPTLRTPRMDTHTYERIRARYTSRLRDFFPSGTIVSCAVDAPEKANFGDLDILVAMRNGQRQTASNDADDGPADGACLPQVDFVDLAAFVCAAGVIVQNSLSCSLAVPLSPHAYDPSKPPILYQALSSKARPQSIGPESDEAYAQVDIKMVPADLLPWTEFYDAYGDLGPLLGCMFKRPGFKVDDRGLWLRLAELDRLKAPGREPANIPDREGLVFLTREPDRVMRFAGLSEQQCRQGFNKLEELFAWLGSSRLLTADAVASLGQGMSRAAGKPMRTVYTMFLDEWLPERWQMSDDGIEQRAIRLRAQRERYAEEAVDIFDKRTEYESKRTTMARAGGNAQATALLRPLVARHSGRPPKALPELLRAFRRRVGADAAGKPCVLQHPLADAESRLFTLLDDEGVAWRSDDHVDAFVRGNWAHLLGLERQRAKSG